MHSFQNQTAHAYARVSAPNSIRCSGERGMGARGTVQSTRTHVWSQFLSKFVPCQIVSVGRGGGSPPVHRRAARVFLGVGPLLFSLILSTRASSMAAAGGAATGGAPTRAATHRGCLGPRAQGRSFFVSHRQPLVLRLMYVCTVGLRLGRAGGVTPPAQ